MNSAKEVFDELFKEFIFDKKMYQKVIHNNISFMTKNNEYKNFFGGKLVGTHIISYTMYDKDIFYNNIFNMSYNEVSKEINKITTINQNFKVARDDINLVCMYIAHRFLSNSELKKDTALEYAAEILNYFNYRTLVLISSKYFIYPISEEKALTLSERLSQKYIIKKLKNWNEYCHYRSDEFLTSKFLPALTKFTDDEETPKYIADLYNRTKDMLKNIYSEFIDMMENDDIIKSKKSVVNDIEGQEVIADKIGSQESYFIKLEQLMVDKYTFVNKTYINVVTDIIESVSNQQLEDTLSYLFDYNFVNRETNIKVNELMKSILINTVEYLNNSDIFLRKNVNVLTIINAIVGNVLYARGTDISVNKVKDDCFDLIKVIYKHFKVPISDRNAKNIRNAVYIYIVLSVVLN